MNEDDLKDLRAMNLENFHRLWIKAKADDYNDVTDEDEQLMKIMLDHEDEYSEIFEKADVLDDDEFGAEAENNPFMHIIIHSIVENQLEKRQPIEAYQFYLAMLKKKCPRHEVIHLIAAIFTNFLFRVLKYLEPFDNDGYTHLLKKYKNQNPHRIWTFLEAYGESEESEEFDLPDADDDTLFEDFR